MSAGFLSAFVVGLLVLPGLGLEITNCTQKQLKVPGCRSGTSVLDTYAVFVIETHSDANNSGHADIYDATTKTWKSSQMPTPSRTNMCSTTWKHLAIFAGGTAGRGLPKSKTVNVWDSTTDTWSTYNMSIGRDELACASVGDFTLFAGGSAPQANQSETDEVDIWNHKTGVWTKAKLSQKRKKPEAVTAGGKIVFAGGEIGHHPPSSIEASSPSLGSYSDAVDVFDPETMSWSITNMPFPPRQYFGAAKAGDKAVFAGGFYNHIRLNDVAIYDAAANVWTVGPPLTHNRSNLHSSSVAAARYAAFGSGNIDSVAKLTFDFFDSKTGDWVASHAHAPGNPAVVGINNVALFLGCDGVFDALALDDATCSGWNQADSAFVV